MHRESPSWILIEGSSPAAIQKAVVKHAGLARHIVPTSHRVLVFALDGERHGICFDPPIPPYEFTNLIGWLDDPRMTAGVVRAVGWLTSPGTGIRYYLASKRTNKGGDTLVGVSAEGDPVQVFLPDCALRPTRERVAPLPEPALSLTEMQLIVEFEITVDSNRSFGNPDFVAS